MIFLALLTSTIWIALWLFRGGFWRMAENKYITSPLPRFPSVVAVIPARDEAAGIGDAIASLLVQDYPVSIHIIVVDDHSSDGTAAIAAERASQLDKINQLTVITGQPLPPGWTGKLWAVHQGVLEAQRLTPEFILLTDADITHAVDNIRNLVTKAEAEKFDLVSLMVRLSCRSFAEKCLIPAFVFFFFMLYPPNWTANATMKTAGAAGGCMLVRKAMMDKVGGVASIKNALIDDCALADQIKNEGGKVSLAVTRSTFSTRIYPYFRDIWSMIARTAFTQLGYSSVMLGIAIIGLLATYILPVTLAFFSSGLCQVAGVVTWIAMVAIFQPVLRLYRLSPLWGIAVPLMAMFYMAATFSSAIHYWRGKGGQWKGRSQAV